MFVGGSLASLAGAAAVFVRPKFVTAQSSQPDAVLTALNGEFIDTYNTAIADVPTIHIETLRRYAGNLRVLRAHLIAKGFDPLLQRALRQGPRVDIMDSAAHLHELQAAGMHVTHLDRRPPTAADLDRAAADLMANGMTPLFKQIADKLDQQIATLAKRRGAAWQFAPRLDGTEVLPGGFHAVQFGSSSECYDYFSAMIDYLGYYADLACLSLGILTGIEYYPVCLVLYANIVILALIRDTTCGQFA